METRILIPGGLRLIVTDSEAKSSEEFSTISKSNLIKSEDDSEEKPSSSSGHCETVEDHQNQFKSRSRKCKEKRDSSTCEEDDDSWKKEQKIRFTTFSSSPSTSSTMSPATLDSSSSSSDNEVDVDYFVKARQKSENAIGSSRNSLECKKSPSNARKQECEDDKTNAAGDKIIDHYPNHVKICATRVIEKGTVFTPNDGDVQVAYLKGIQPIPKDDVRFIFGCFETITQAQLSPQISSSPASDPLISPASTTASPPPSTSDTGDRSGSNCNFVRLCNWVRFLRRNSSLRNMFSAIPQPQKSYAKPEDNNDNWNNDRKMDTHKKRNIFQMGDINESSDWPNSTNDSSKKSILTTTNITPGETNDKSHNMIAHFEEGRPMFEVTERLVPGTELVALFDMNSVFKSTSSISPYMTMMMSTLPNMLAKKAEAATPSSPPAPSSSSTLISSSSPPPPPGLLSFSGAGTGNVGLGGVKKDRDEKELLQHHHQRLIMPAYPYSFYDNYAALENKALFTNSTQISNAFRFGEGNTAQFGKEGKITHAKIKQEFQGAQGIADGPLDLSKFPSFSKSQLEPLKIGTPFDSPDSNDDDQTKRIPSPSVKCEEETSPLFSIKNVLKPKSSVAPCKLFQPYSLEIGKKSPDKDAFMRALISSNPSSSSNALGTSPRSDFPLTGRNAGGLRPILRTRGRERSLLPCEVCGKAFDRPSLLKRHLRTHTGEKPHICDVCSKGFSTSSSLNTHRRIHSGEKPHQCPICGKRFTASSNLYYHRMTHNKEKPHKCMLCGKSFPTPGDLKSHQYVHSGSWPYTCQVCHRGFSKQTNLRNHLLLHSGMTNNTGSNKPGDKPHTCQVCGQKFAQACNLRAHVKTHEDSDSSSTLTSSCSVCKRTILPTSEMLLNGRCRSCQLRIPSNKTSYSDHSGRRDSISSSPAANPCVNPHTVEKVKEGFTPSYENNTTATSLLSQRFLAQGNASQQQLASSIGSLNLPLSQFSGLSIPGLTNALAFPTNVTPLHFSLNVNPTASNPADLLSSAGGTQSTARNTLFDTLVEWNYRMAKESVGLGSLSLGLMQQKLLESQSRMIASQFMNTHGFGMGGGIQDILSLRPTMNPEGFSALDPVVSSESKYLQR